MPDIELTKGEIAEIDAEARLLGNKALGAEKKVIKLVASLDIDVPGEDKPIVVEHTCSYPYNVFMNTLNVENAFIGDFRNKVRFNLSDHQHKVRDAIKDSLITKKIASKGKDVKAAEAAKKKAEKEAEKARKKAEKAKKTEEPVEIPEIPDIPE